MSSATSLNLGGQLASAAIGVMASFAIIWSLPRMDPLYLVPPSVVAAGVVLGFFRYGFRFAIPYLVFFESAAWMLTWNTIPMLGRAGLLQPQRIEGLLIGFQLLVLLMIAFAGRRGSIRLWSSADGLLMFMFYVGGAIVAAVVGVAHQNSRIYLIGDTYNLLLVPAAYILTQLLGQRASPEFLLGSVVVAQLVGNNLPLLFVRLHSAVVGDITRYGGPIMLPFLYFFVRYLNEQQRKARALYLILFLVCALAVVATNSRRCWIMGATIVLLALLMKRRGAISRTLARVSVVLLAAAWIALLMAALPDVRRVAGEVATDTGHKFFHETFVSGGLGSSGDTKVQEAERAFRGTVMSGSTMRAAFGNGSGAQYFLKYEGAQYAQTDYMVHNIHNNYLAFLHRMGLAALGLFCIFLVALWRTLRRLMSQRSKLPVGQRSVIEVLYVEVIVLAVFEANTINPFYGQLYWGVLLGIVGLLSRNLPRSLPGRMIRGNHASLVAAAPQPDQRSASRVSPLPNES